MEKRKASILESMTHKYQKTNIEKYVICLQRSWRNKFKLLTTYNIVQNLLLNNITVDYIKSISFETLAHFLREPNIISSSKICLRRIHILCDIRHGSPNQALIPENINIKVFLAGFMIAYTPTHVFESINILENELLEAATQLFKNFYLICESILSSKNNSFQNVSHEITKDFSTLLYEYLKKFKAWKVPDEEKLKCRIIHALNALYQANDQLPLDEPDDSKLKTEFRNQIKRLRNKLQQISGIEVLNQFDEQYKTQQPIQKLINKNLSGGLYTQLPGKITTEQLAHELLLNPNFQLDKSNGCSVENPIFQRIKETFHQAFWDSLVDDLKLSRPSYTRVLRVLKEICDGTNELAGINVLSENVDLEFIKQQAEANLYTWDNCKNLISSIVESIQNTQMPKRNEETKLLWDKINEKLATVPIEEQPRTFCKALEFLLDRVNTMRIDAANARLELIVPVIKEHGIYYERSKFQDKIDNGSLTLERTQNWIRSNLRREIMLKNERLEDLLDGKDSAFINIHSSAIISLIIDNDNIKEDKCPETLLFDVHRLAMLQQEFQYIVKSTIIILLVTQSITSTKNVSDLELLSNINDLFANEIKLENVDFEINEILKLSTLTKENIMILINSYNNSTSPTDKLYKLIYFKIINIFRYFIIHGTIPMNTVKAIEKIIPLIIKTSTKILSLANLNRTVHQLTYNKLIKDESIQLKSE